MGRAEIPAPRAYARSEVNVHIEFKIGNKQWDEYSVDMEDGRKAFLSVRRESNPLRVDGGSATGVSTFEERCAAVKEASDWLVAEIEAGRA